MKGKLTGRAGMKIFTYSWVRLANQRRSKMYNQRRSKREVEAGRAAHLATSGLWRAASRRGSVLMSTAQQGKQASKRIRTPLWRITPTRFRFPLP